MAISAINDTTCGWRTLSTSCDPLDTWNNPPPVRLLRYVQFASTTSGSSTASGVSGGGTVQVQTTTYQGAVIVTSTNDPTITQVSHQQSSFVVN
jgi:hypothetical protein